jgi:hypothetical protein
MTPDEHIHHGGHEHEHEPTPTAVLETEESPPTLLEKPTVTIYFDGLIYMAYNEDDKLYQSAVLTQAEGHHLLVEVKLQGENNLLFPTKETDWEPDHATVKAKAPFWLYVDSGQGIPGEFSATLNLTDLEDPQSFKHIFDFQKRYHRPIVPKPETFAKFNFPHGISYSAKNTNAALLTLRPDQDVKDATIDKDKFNVSTLAAIDIDAVSAGDDKKSIVLASDGGKKGVFSFDLEPGKHYEIRFLNVPIEGVHASHSAQDHFRQFYELFDLKEGEEQFLVAPPKAMAAAAASGETVAAAAPTPTSPPCVSTTGDTKGGLGGGS